MYYISLFFFFLILAFLFPHNILSHEIFGYFTHCVEFSLHRISQEKKIGKTTGSSYSVFIERRNRRAARNAVSFQERATRVSRQRAVTPGRKIATFGSFFKPAAFSPRLLWLLITPTRKNDPSGVDMLGGCGCITTATSQ